MMTAVAASSGFASFVPSMGGKGEPQGLRWRDRLMRVAISSSVVSPNPNIKSDSDVIGAIRRSIATWESAADIKIELDFTERATVSPAGIVGDGVSLITIAATPENALLFAKDPMAESAKTRVFYNARNHITEADVVLNPYQQFSTDGTFGTFDLESTLTHELGHVLGLKHSSVLGATMSGTLPKNGAFGTPEFSGRTLSDSDLAAIREVYGVSEDDTVCCGAIAGRVAGGNPRSMRGLKLWAEESTTGRVAAVAEAAADGTFRLGGLSAGVYSVFFQRDSDPSADVGVIGTYRLDKDETRLLSEKIVLDRNDVGLSYVGVNSQLTDSAVSLRPGGEYTLFLGGRNLDPAALQIEFNSPFITVTPGTLYGQDFGTGVSALSVVVNVHPDTPPGLYSVFATGNTRTLSSLVGAINIQ